MSRRLTDDEQASLEKAETELKSGKYKSIKDAAVKNNVPYSTLFGRIRYNHKSHRKAIAHSQLLSEAEECLLVEVITQLGMAGYKVSYDEVKGFAVEIMRRKSGDIREDVSTTRALGQHWINRFFKRHPQLKGIVVTALEKKKQTISIDQFQLLQQFSLAYSGLISKFKIKEKDIYSMCDFDFSIQESSGTWKIVSNENSPTETSLSINDSSSQSRSQSRSQSQSNNSDLNSTKKGRSVNLTLVECISGTGATLPPYIMFKDVTVLPNWLPKDSYSDWTFIASVKGWENSGVPIHWFDVIFNEHSNINQDTFSSDKDIRLIIFGSNMKLEFFERCMNNNVCFLRIPYRILHLVHPLKLLSFGNFDQFFNIPTDEEQLDVKRNKTDKQEWLTTLSSARKAAFPPHAIVSRWRETGLIPFRNLFPDNMISNNRQNPLPLLLSTSNLNSSQTTVNYRPESSNSRSEISSTSLPTSSPVLAFGKRKLVRMSTHSIPQPIETTVSINSQPVLTSHPQQDDTFNYFDLDGDYQGY